MLPKIRQLRAMPARSGTWTSGIEVDGGIDLATAAECRAAGADTFVVGTSFFRAPDQAAFAAAIARL